jgi:hypothetical protein
MPDTSRDPVDHARTTRQHAGETMKAGINAPGLIAIGLGVLGFVVGLFSLARGQATGGVVGIAVGVLLVAAGLGWLAFRHHQVQKAQKDWHREHPEAHYEPPTS